MAWGSRTASSRANAPPTYWSKWTSNANVRSGPQILFRAIRLFLHDFGAIGLWVGDKTGLGHFYAQLCFGEFAGFFPLQMRLASIASQFDNLRRFAETGGLRAVPATGIDGDAVGVKMNSPLAPMKGLSLFAGFRIDEFQRLVVALIGRGDNPALVGGDAYVRIPRGGADAAFFSLL